MRELEPVALEPLDGPEPTIPVGRRSWTVDRGSRRWNLAVAATVGGLAAAAVAPVLVLPAFEARLVTRFVALAVALAGLQFVVGTAKQLSLCHGAFVGTGSYALAICVTTFGLPHVVGLLLAPLIGFAAGCAVGVMAVRIRATYLGPVTLGVAVAFPSLVKRFGWFTGGSNGLPLVRGPAAPAWLGPLADRPVVWTHLVVVAVAAAALMVMRNLTLAPPGMAVRAMADEATAASSSGIDVRRLRIVTYGIGAGFGALGGALVVMDTPIVGADSHDLFRSLTYYAAVMVGGATSLAGGVIGAALVLAVPWLIAGYRLQLSPNFVFGVLLLAATLAAPGGLAAPLRNLLSAVVEVRDGEPRPP